MKCLTRAVFKKKTSKFKAKNFIAPDAPFVYRRHVSDSSVKESWTTDVLTKAVLIYDQLT